MIFKSVTVLCAAIVATSVLAGGPSKLSTIDEKIYPFPVLVNTVLDDGLPPPFGATVSNAHGEKIGIVAREGRILVSGLKNSEKLSVRWGDKVREQCTFDYVSAQTKKSRFYEVLNTVCTVPTSVYQMSITCPPRSAKKAVLGVETDACVTHIPHTIGPEEGGRNARQLGASCGSPTHTLVLELKAEGAVPAKLTDIKPLINPIPTPALPLAPALISVKDKQTTDITNVAHEKISQGYIGLGQPGWAYLSKKKFKVSNATEVTTPMEISQSGRTNAERTVAMLHKYEQFIQCTQKGATILSCSEKQTISEESVPDVKRDLRKYSKAKVAPRHFHSCSTKHAPKCGSKHHFRLKPKVTKDTPVIFPPHYVQREESSAPFVAGAWFGHLKRLFLMKLKIDTDS